MLGDETRMKKLSATVTGRVQGVGYRMFAQDAARRLGISGYARNLSDGSVHVYAEGEERALQEFARHLERGPRGAWVEGVACDWSEAGPDAGRGEFEVRD